MVERGVACKVMVGKPEEKSTWKTQAYMGKHVKLDIREVGCGSMDWIDLGQDRDSRRALVNAVMNLRIR